MSQLMSLVPKEKRMMRELKRHASVKEWNQLQNFVAEVLGINEADGVSDQQIEDLIIKAAKELKAAGKIDTVPTDIDVDKLEKGDKSGIEIAESKRRIHESLVVALVAAAPTLIEMLAKLVEWVYRQFALSSEERKKWKEEKAAFDYAKKTGKKIDGSTASDEDIHHMEDALFKSKAGKLILKAAHGLHNLYVGPLRLVIAGLTYLEGGDSWLTVWKDSKKTAEFLYCIIMLGVAGYGILHTLPAITGLASSTIAPIASATIEATKGGEMTASIIKKVLGHVHI